jgi:L-ascorbate metabolism protein UlaG (beta-lactamase superfamily)
MLEMGGARLLTDPVLRDRVLHIHRRSAPVAPELTADLDAVLLSHLHSDHLDPPSLRRLDRTTPIVAPLGSRRLLRRRGFTEVVELDPGESTSIGGVRLTAVAVRHEGRRYPIGRSIQAVGYDIRAAARVFFAGDTGPFDVRELAGGIDVALLPIAGWGPRLNLRHHLDPATAAKLAAELRPRVAVPIHWGTLLRMGLDDRSEELLESPPSEFAAHMAELAPTVSVRVLSPGESMPLPSPAP